MGLFWYHHDELLAVYKQSRMISAIMQHDIVLVNVFKVPKSAGQGVIKKRTTQVHHPMLLIVWLQARKMCTLFSD
jgi:hypothetical protein